MIIELKNKKTIRKTVDNNPKNIYFCDYRSFLDINPHYRYVDLKELFKNQIIRFENHLDVDIICIPAIYGLGDEDIIYVFAEKDNMYFVGEDKRLDEFKENHFADEDKGFGQIISAFLNYLLNDYSKMIDEREQKIMLLEDSIITMNKVDEKNISKYILDHRRRLLFWKKIMEELMDIIDYLIEDNNEFYSKADIRRFSIIRDKIDRMYNNVETLLDLLSEVREAYQSTVDIRQNRIMSVLTMVSTIFLPLTLIVGWYGMNLKMPEFNNPYSYPIVICLCVMIVVWCVYFFKKNKWL